MKEIGLLVTLPWTKLIELSVAFHGLTGKRVRLAENKVELPVTGGCDPINPVKKLSIISD